MNDLLQKQILESCKLALPEGLKDLMSDISREVIRARPRDIYKFIANYLHSLLEVRETLAIACRICKETYECACEFDLYEELRNVGLNEEDAAKAVDIIEEHFKRDTVKEQSLFLKLIRKINIEENQVEALKSIVVRAYNRYERSSIDKVNGDNDENVAAQRTLSSYEKDVKIVDEIPSPTYIYMPNTKALSSVSLAGSTTFAQSSANSLEPAVLSKLSEECGSLDYTKGTINKNVQEDTTQGVKFSSHIEHNESSDSSSEMDIIFESKRNIQSSHDQKQQDTVIADDDEIIVEEIREEERESESSIIEESLLNSPRGSDN